MVIHVYPVDNQWLTKSIPETGSTGHRTYLTALTRIGNYVQERTLRILYKNEVKCGIRTAEYEDSEETVLVLHPKSCLTNAGAVGGRQEKCNQKISKDSASSGTKGIGCFLTRKPTTEEAVGSSSSSSSSS
jgi:hypothetical protein